MGHSNFEWERETFDHILGKECWCHPEPCSITRGCNGLMHLTVDMLIEDDPAVAPKWWTCQKCGQVKELGKFAK